MILFSKKTFRSLVLRILSLFVFLLLVKPAAAAPASKAIFPEIKKSYNIKSVLYGKTNSTSGSSGYFTAYNNGKVFNNLNPIRIAKLSINQIELSAGNNSLTISRGKIPNLAGAPLHQIVQKKQTLFTSLLNFSGKKTTYGIKLVWNTTDKGKNTRFTIEKSFDNGNYFIEIGRLNSNGIGTYSWLDKSLLDGCLQYRLKISDDNGIVRYSDIVKINYLPNADPTSIVFVYPYKASNKIKLVINQKSDKTSIDFLEDGIYYDPPDPDLPKNTTRYKIEIFEYCGKRVKMDFSIEKVWFSNIEILNRGYYIVMVKNVPTNKLVGKCTFFKI